MITETPRKKLYTWNWVGGGYNQCYAHSKREARKKGNAISPNFTINESSFRLVKDVDAFWRNYPIFD